MIFQHTIQHQDAKEFDKLCSKFMNEQGENLIGVEYAANVIPMQAQPVNIPGVQLKQLQVQLMPFYFAFFTYKVAEGQTIETGKTINLHA